MIASANIIFILFVVLLVVDVLLRYQKVFILQIKLNKDAMFYEDIAAFSRTLRLYLNSVSEKEFIRMKLITEAFLLNNLIII